MVTRPPAILPTQRLNGTLRIKRKRCPILVLLRTAVASHPLIKSEEVLRVARCRRMQPLHEGALTSDHTSASRIGVHVAQESIMAKRVIGDESIGLGALGAAPAVVAKDSEVPPLRSAEEGRCLTAHVPNGLARCPLLTASPISSEPLDANIIRALVCVDQVGLLGTIISLVEEDVHVLGSMIHGHRRRLQCPRPFRRATRSEPEWELHVHAVLTADRSNDTRLVVRCQYRAGFERPIGKIRRGVNANTGRH